MTDKQNTTHEAKPNRLLHETSPYLLQHAYNPVDWYPWGPEALERAKEEDKPIFLSIGYSACHWCHVMEHESFEDPDIGRLMSENFVCIKVDREERPDLDHIYMTAVQMLTRHGGWPMSVFLTPELKPFYGGTYWPPDDRMNLPGFRRILDGMIDAWQNRRDEVETAAGQVTENLRLVSAGVPAKGPLDLSLEETSVATLHQMFDQTHGGFGSAPKFPHAMDLKLLLRSWKRTGNREALYMVRMTLDKMAGGGIYDHLGGGFHRYSVDARWLVPHFEKMLYDNALLTQVYLEAYQATGAESYATVARETLDYVLREMTDDGGGFYSTQDADSEGEEGKFFVWTPDEVQAVLGEKLAKTFTYVYDVTEFGNWEGTSILNRPKTLEQDAKLLNLEPAELEKQLEKARKKLLKARNERVAPGRDDKVIVAWNGLMIDAFAQADQVLDDRRYGEAAIKAAEFILKHLRRDDGRLLHTYKDAQAKLDAYLDDYAFFTNALVTLYECTFVPQWIDVALELTEILCEHFWDPSEGGFFYTADDHEQLVTRTKDLIDSSIPSGNAMAALLLLRLGRLTGRSDLLEKAEATLKVLAAPLQSARGTGGQALVALDFYLGPTQEFALLLPAEGEEIEAVLKTLRETFLPNKVVAAHREGSEIPEPLEGLLAGKTFEDNRPTIYICENFACQAPVVGIEGLKEALEGLEAPQR